MFGELLGNVVLGVQFGSLELSDPEDRQDMVVSGESGVLGGAAAPATGPSRAGKMCGWISRGLGVTGPGSCCG